MDLEAIEKGPGATCQSYAQHALTASAHQEAQPFLHLTPAPAGMLEADVAFDLLPVDAAFSAVEPWPVEAPVVEPWPLEPSRVETWPVEPLDVESWLGESPEDEPLVDRLPEEGAPETCSAAVAGVACPTFTSTFESDASIGTSSYSTTHSSSTSSYRSKI